MPRRRSINRAPGRASRGSVAALVPAAGTGTRFGGSISKPLHPLRGQPLLVHTLRALQGHPAIRWIILAVRPDDQRAVVALLKRWAISKALPPCPGGSSRAESVANAFAQVPPQADWVLVHDAARPCLTRRVIDGALQGARRHGAVACGLPASLTVKAVDAQRAVRLTLDRESLWFVQTPQVFRRAWFSDALARTNGDLTSFPDDAAIVESAGFPVSMVPGDPLNIKVTTQEDLLLAETILASRNGR